MICPPADLLHLIFCDSLGICSTLRTEEEAGKKRTPRVGVFWSRFVDQTSDLTANKQGWMGLFPSSFAWFCVKVKALSGFFLRHRLSDCGSLTLAAFPDAVFSGTGLGPWETGSPVANRARLAELPDSDTFSSLVCVCAFGPSGLPDCLVSTTCVRVHRVCQV